MKKLHIIILILIIFLSLFLLYNRLTYMDVIVKFDDLEPFDRQMPVYFKGFKIGKTTKIYPDKDYQNTYLKLKLKSSKINFPSNVSVNIKKKKIGGYVNIIYPDAPSLTKLKNDDVIKGILTKDINSILEDTVTGDDIATLVDDTTGLMENANNAVNSLNEIFVEIREIIADSRNDIKTATSNLAKTTKNLEEMSRSLSDTVQSDSVSNSIKNIEDITENLSGATSQIDNTTIPMVNGVLCQTQSITANVNEITCGVKNTLKKHFGLGRLLFGKPVNNKCD